MHRRFIAGSALTLALGAPFLAAAAVNDDVEAKIKEHFPSVPVMLDIARCESNMRQFYGKDLPLAGGTGGNMIGLFQINAPVHAEYALSLGMDIYTLEGNVAYAKLLYENEGTRPWRSSSKCWGSEAAEIARLKALIAELTALLNSLLAERLASAVQ